MTKQRHKRGRPVIGERIMIRIPGKLLERVETFADTEFCSSRADAVRVLLVRALKEAA